MIDEFFNQFQATKGRSPFFRLVVIVLVAIAGTFIVIGTIYT
jgi:hypothetical protein